MKKNIIRLTSSLSLLALLAACQQKPSESAQNTNTQTQNQASAAQCEVNRKIVFAGNDWDSNAFHTAVAQHIIQKGYGCEVDQVPGTTVPLINGLIKGDVDVNMEIWYDNVKDQWDKGVKDGKVQIVGVSIMDSAQGWFVPKYLIEGADAPAAGLKSVADLPKYKAVFKDREEPSKGRFYNGVAGWGAEEINTKKLAAYQLNDSYVNFRPGTGSALTAAIESAMKQKKPILFYHWGPTWVLGKYADQIQMLEEPAFDQAIWDKFSTEKSPKQAVAYPVQAVNIGANSEFAKSAPKLIEFLSKYSLSSAEVSEVLAYMQDNGGSVDAAAINFLKTKPDLWMSWVPADVAERVKSTL